MPHSFSKTSLSFIFLFSIAASLAFAQTISSSISKDEFLFKKGSLLQELAVEGLGLNETIKDKQDQSRSAYATEIKESILDEALKYYQELADSFPKSPFFYKALINQGRIKLELEDTVEAEKSLQLVLGPKVSDKEKKKIQPEPVADPNSNYKNEAARIMAEIALANREYQRALILLDERKKYPRTGSYCGFDSDAARTMQLYAKCYMGLKKYQRVCEVLLPNLFSDEMDTDGEELLYEALLRTNKKEELIKKYELAFKNFVADKSKDAYFIVFLNRQIDILPLLKPALLIQDAAYPGNEMDKIYKSTWLYERLQSTEESKKP
jgi:tetratricopeptide (TPR) repeat protein